MFKLKNNNKNRRRYAKTARKTSRVKRKLFVINTSPRLFNNAQLL